MESVGGARPGQRAHCSAMVLSSCTSPKLLVLVSMFTPGPVLEKPSLIGKNPPSETLSGRLQLRLGFHHHPACRVARQQGYAGI